MKNATLREKREQYVIHNEKDQETKSGVKREPAKNKRRGKKVVKMATFLIVF